jgi:catechol 2,3-dioxygenase-like lactoylglutathione lyase family enzyme
MARAALPLGPPRPGFDGNWIARRRAPDEVECPDEQTMQDRIHVITLAVSDLDRALAFYREGLGLESPGVIGTEFPGDSASPAGAVAMFQLQGGLILALWPRTELAKDANIPLGPPKTGEFSIGHAVASKAHVDELLRQAEAAGATTTDQAHDRPWGIYSGYFRDPDGHLWEIMWNPQLDLGAT